MRMALLAALALIARAGPAGDAGRAAAPEPPGAWVVAPAALWPTSAAADAAYGGEVPAAAGARPLSRGERVTLVGGDDLAVEVATAEGRRGFVRRDLLWPAAGVVLGTVLKPAPLLDAPRPDAAAAGQVEPGAVLLVIGSEETFARVVHAGAATGWIAADALVTRGADVAAAVLLARARSALVLGDAARAREALEGALAPGGASALAVPLAAALGVTLPLPPRDAPAPPGTAAPAVLEARAGAAELEVAPQAGAVDWKEQAARALQGAGRPGPDEQPRPAGATGEPAFAYDAAVPPALARGAYYAVAAGGVAEVAPARLAGHAFVDPDDPRNARRWRHDGALVLRGVAPGSRGDAFVLWSPVPLRFTVSPVVGPGRPVAPGAVGAPRLLPEEGDAVRALVAERTPWVAYVVEAQPGGKRWLYVAYPAGDGDGCDFHDALYAIGPKMERVGYVVYGCGA